MPRHLSPLLFALTIFFCQPLISCRQLSSDQIVVELSTEQQLSPLYLVPFIDNNSSFTPTYLQSLENILQFDLSNNAYTQLVAGNAQKDRISSIKNLDNFGNSAEWLSNGIAFVIKAEIKEKKLTSKILQVSNNVIKAIDPLPLTGNINQDRRQIHRIADTINTALFGVEGIASTRILYTLKYPTNNKSKPEWLSEIWEVDYDGANARKISDQTNGYCITPCYLPAKAGFQSAAFLYVSYKNGQPKIYLAPLKEGSHLRFSSLRGNQLMPAVSRQRDKIAFISDLTGNPDLFLQDFSAETGPLGKPRQIFTAKGATQGSPTFSPDGKQIAFVSNKDGSPRIYTMTIPEAGVAAKNIKPRLITHSNRENSAPSWSPDGSKIAYCARHGKERQIWIYDLKSNEEWQLTTGAGDKENPSWAPNSLHLTYNTTGGHLAELFIINIAQRLPQKITSGYGEKRFPSWEPRF